MHTALSYLISACTGKLFQWCFLVAGAVPSTSDKAGSGWEDLHEGENGIKNIGKKSKWRETLHKEGMGEDEAATWQGERKKLVLCWKVLWFSVQNSAGFHLGLIFLAIFYSCWCLWLAG